MKAQKTKVYNPYKRRARSLRKLPKKSEKITKKLNTYRSKHNLNDPIRADSPKTRQKTGSLTSRARSSHKTSITKLANSKGHFSTRSINRSSSRRSGSKSKAKIMGNNTATKNKFFSSLNSMASSLFKKKQSMDFSRNMDMRRSFGGEAVENKSEIFIFFFVHIF